MKSNKMLNKALKGLETERITFCPVCLSRSMEYMMPHMKKVDFPKQFSVSDHEWLAMCKRCGTLFRIPLPDDPKVYNEQYYNQMHVDGEFRDTAERHIVQSQIANYERVLQFFRASIDPNKYKRWLDVGSGGYPTKFKEYDFITIEPDRRVVGIGRELFKTDKIYCGNIESYDFRSGFDGVLFQNSFYCIPIPNTALQRVHSLLSDQGLLIIGIGSYLMETKAHTSDGNLLRIEDVLRGDSHWLYYNRYSLQYICLRNGFILENCVELDSYNSNRSVKYFIFRKHKSEKDNGLLDQSYNCNRMKLKSLFDSFSQKTADNLQIVNKRNTIFIGTEEMISDLRKINSMDAIIGFINYSDGEIGVKAINGIPYISIECLKEVTEDGNKYNVVIASYKYQQEIIKAIEVLVNPSQLNIFMPTRDSGIEKMFISFGKEEVLSKAFTLKAINRPSSGRS
jgi:SAM-dependent methyltransferase